MNIKEQLAKSKSLPLGALAFLAAAILCFILPQAGLVGDYGKSTTGYATIPTPAPDGKGCALVAAFKIDEKTYVTEGKTVSPALCNYTPGDEIEVFYNPNEPAKSEVAQADNEGILKQVIYVVGVILGLFAFVAFSSWKSEREWDQENSKKYEIGEVDDSSSTSVDESLSQPEATDESPKMTENDS